MVSPQQVSPELALAPDWSLYAIDFAQNRALFVELPPDASLGAVTFVYMAQFQQAKRAIALPIDELIPLSQRVELPESFGMLFSTGRCGSTLASHILAEVPGVWSLSEPDVLTNTAHARFEVPSARIGPVLAAVTRLLFAPPKEQTIQTFVIKPRSEALIQAPEYALALPASRNVFMYRDALGFVNSLYQFVQKLIGPEAFFHEEAWKIGWRVSTVNAPSSLLDIYFPEGRTNINMAEEMLISWVIRLDAYKLALRNGIKMHPLHYDDLNSHREHETARLLGAFGINTLHVGKAMQALAWDSQEGTGGDRDMPAKALSSEQRDYLRQLMAKWGTEDYLDQRLSAAG